MNLKALKQAYKDAKKADIQTTAEGRSFLNSRYKFWLNKGGENNMPITDMIIKVVGIVIALIGFGLLISCFGISVGVSFMSFGILGQFVMGLVMSGIGIYILKGGSIVL